MQLPCWIELIPRRGLPAGAYSPPKLNGLLTLTAPPAAGG